MRARTLLFVAAIGSFGSTLAGASPTRIWVFTPALTQEARKPDPSGKAIAVVAALTHALEADRSVKITDSPDSADVMVEVAAASRIAYDGGNERMVETVQLTITAGPHQTMLLTTAARAKDASSQACKLLLRWIHDHPQPVQTDRD